MNQIDARAPGPEDRRTEKGPGRLPGILPPLVGGLLAWRAGWHRSVSIDEASVLFRTGTESWAATLQIWLEGPAGNASLHFVLLRLLSGGNLDSVAPVRAASIAAFGLALWLLWSALRHRTAGWIATGITTCIALSPILIYYGGDGRWYAWIILCVAAAIHGWARQKPRQVLVAATAMTAFHAPAAVLGLPLAAATFRHGQHKAATILAVIIQAAWIGLFLRQAGDPYWNIPVGGWYPSVGIWLGEALQFLWGAPLATALAVLALTLAGTRIALTRHPHDMPIRALVFAGWLLPIPLALAAAVLLEHNLAVRYFLMATPISWVGLALGLEALRHRHATLAAAGLALGLVLSMIALTQARPGLFEAKAKGTSAADISGLMARCVDADADAAERTLHVWDPLLYHLGRFHAYYGPYTYAGTCRNLVGEGYEFSRFSARTGPLEQTRIRPLTPARNALALLPPGREHVELRFYQAIFSDRMMQTMDIARLWVATDWDNHPQLLQLADALQADGFRILHLADNTLIAAVTVPATNEALLAAWLRFARPWIALRRDEDGLYFAGRLLDRLLPDGDRNPLAELLLEPFPELRYPPLRERIRTIMERE